MVSIGVALFISAFGNFLNAVGYILEKKGHINVLQQMQENPDKQHPGVCTDPTWVTGFVTYVIGSLLHAYALGQGPQSLFTPMQAVTLVCNTILSPLFLPETLSSVDLIATALIVISVIGAVIFGPKNEEEYTTDDLMKKYTLTPFVILTVICFMSALIGWFVSVVFQRRNDKDGIKQDGSLEPRYAVYFVICYSCLGGLGASYNVLFLKSVVTLLEQMPDALKGWGFWVILAGLIWANGFLEYWKQKALGTFGALYVVPIFQVILVVGGCLVGAVYFDEFSQLTTVDLILFLVSIFFCLLGVGVLAASSAEREDEIFERMKNEMVSYTRFMQSIEILKSIIWDQIKDMEEEQDVNRRKKRMFQMNTSESIANKRGSVGNNLRTPASIDGAIPLLKKLATKGNLLNPKDI